MFLGYSLVKSINFTPVTFSVRYSGAVSGFPQIVTRLLALEKIFKILILNFRFIGGKTMKSFLTLPTYKMLFLFLGFFMFTSCGNKKQEEKNVTNVIKQVVEEIANSGVLSYNFKYYGEGSIKEKYPLTTGKAKIVILPGDVSGHFEKARIQTELQTGEQSLVVINEGIIYKVDDENKNILRAPSYRIQAELYSQNSLAPVFLLNEIKNSPDKGAKLIGKEKIGTVMCDVVEYQSETLLHKWWFGVEDHLFYCVKVTSEHFGDGALIVEMTNIKTGAKLVEDDYVIALPEGYTHKEYSGNYPVIGEPAPDWTVTDYSGKKIDLKGLRGKVVVLDFWATWCRPCVLSIPGMKKLHKKYQKRNVVILGLATFENGDPVKYMQEKGVDYPIMKGDEVAPKYKVNSLPFVFVIGPDGKIVDFFNGYYGKESDERLENTIISALR